MFLIDLDKIESGDIILKRSSDRESLLIRQRSNSEYSHAILYVGVSSCIESDGLGVQSQNLQRVLIENIDDVAVLRVKDISIKNKIPGVTVFARQKIGMEYSTEEAKIARLENDISAKEPNRQFCTRFIAQAYSHVGIQLVKNPDYCSPQEILESTQLIRVNDILRKADANEIQFAMDKNNILEKQKDIHNFILENAREISKEDIQTFEQLSKFLVENPQFDDSISQIVINSGYLEMWKKEVSNNPWHYDCEKFFVHYKNPIQRNEVGHFFATTESETRKRFKQTLDTLEFAYLVRPLKYFRIQIDLYMKLIELSETRESVGLQVLKNKV